MNGRSVNGICLVVLWSLWATVAGAAEVMIFRTDSLEAVLGGNLEGLSVDPLGAVELARRLEKLSAIDEPFVFSAAADGDGWVVGTGNSGKILRVNSQGETAELAVVGEPEIFAVRIDDDGTVLAASSPHGKVYRIVAGVPPKGDKRDDVEVVFESQDRYVWDLARDAAGRLLVATGLAGHLYRIDARGEVETLYESRDSHVRSIAVHSDGSILLGTAGHGLLVRLDPQGEVTTLHDAIHPEVLDLVIAPSGKAYAALLASEASFVDLSATSTSNASSGSEQDEQKESEKDDASVSVAVQGTDTVGSRSSTFSGPRSVVLEISVNGQVEEIAGFQTETVHSLLWHGGELWIGTGQEGKLYRWSEGRLIREATLEERQIVGLVAGPAGAAAVTANASALYRLHPEAEVEGTYTSSVLDAAQPARFGSFSWQGDLPPGAGLEAAFRSGMSSSPDATWTPWQVSGTVGCTGCDHAAAGGGQEAALAGLAHGRYVQWRAKLARGSKGLGPRLESAELSYRQDNLKPKIEKLEVLDPGQILVPGSFNPQSQTFEPWSPNREGIFTTLRLEQPKNGDGRLKNLWKKGYRTLRWSAKDDNSDPLSYRLDFRREAAEDGWLSMVEEIDKTHYSFDATVLPDGVYRFRLTASDAEGRSDSEALSDQKLSESVVIDNSPPVLESSARRGSAVVVELSDALSPMRDAAVSHDAGEWRRAPVADGLLDGRRETLNVAIPDGASLLLLRVSDAAHNVVTFDLLAEPTSKD